MHFPLGKAVRQSGLSKSTISRAIRDGKLSAVRSADTGSSKIEQAELARYPDATAVARATAGMGAQTQSATPAANPNEAMDSLRASLSDLRGMLADMTARRDTWQLMAETAQRQIADQRERRPWWRRLAG